MGRPLVVVDAGDTAAVIDGVRRALAGDGPAVLPWASDGHPHPALPDEVAESVALVIETSGSTDRPKRVALSAKALLASAAASERALGGAGRWLLALPLGYIAGINVVVRSIAAGTDPLQLEPGSFDVGRFLDVVDRMGAGRRFTSLVPVQLARLLDAAAPSEGTDARAPGVLESAAPAAGAVDPEALLAGLRSFDRILVGGQATPRPLLDRAAALGIRVTVTYGSSETSGGCVYDGRPLDGARARVRHGELHLAGPMLAEGYLADPDRTDRAFVVDDGIRWYRAADTGHVVDGLVQVTGRLDDVVISGGVKVSLGEVERVVLSLAGVAGVAEVVVVPAASAWGEVPVVVSDSPLELDPVRTAVAAALGKAAAPSRIVVVERMPRLANGKPDRVALRALVASDRGRLPGRRTGAR